MMKTLVRFQSDSFPYKENECINPHLYGEQLAVYIAKQLPMFGYEVLDYYPEDVGWEIRIHNATFPLYIRCSNQGNGDDWFCCMISPNKPVIRQWFKKIDTTDRVEKLSKALNTILNNHQDIHCIEWEDES